MAYTVTPAAEEPNGKIIAGTGANEKTFYAPKSALEKSSVIKGWIEDKSLPSSLQKGDALYFPKCDPEVVHATIEYLSSPTSCLMTIRDPLAGASENALFYVGIYKFALCLGLSELCIISLNKIKELARDTEAFLHVLSVSTEENTSLVDDRQFRGWLMGYLAQKSEVLKESACFKKGIKQNSELAWRLCSLLISSVGGTANGTGAQFIPNPIPSTPRSRVSSMPDIERRKSPYSHQPQRKPPSVRKNISRVEKPQRASVRNFNPTVEDASD